MIPVQVHLWDRDGHDSRSDVQDHGWSMVSHDAVYVHSIHRNSSVVIVLKVFEGSQMIPR